MLNKNQKLALRKERQFFSTAQRRHDKTFSLFWKPNQSRLLLQVILARKTAPNAVKRNEVKRAVSKVLKEIATSHTTTALSLVVVIKNFSALQELDKIRHEIEAVVTK